ncbi:hypothetical protein LOTGIDRAFT_139886, partial [Lottia gigantea]
LYKTRWYVLMVFSLFTACQYLVWNTWGPISDTAKHAYNWSDSDIALLANWGPIMICITVIFYSWLLDVKGIRVACIISCFCITLGSGCRCISQTPPISTWMMHLGQLLNGCAGAVAMSASPVISSTWFPPNERTTATAIGVLIPDVIGLAGSFLIGMFLAFIYHYHYIYTYSHWKLIRIDSLFTDLQSIAEFGIVVCVFLLMLIYFPKKPPLPPCTSASVSRKNFIQGLKEIIRNRNILMVGIAYGSALGVSNVWAGVLNLILQPLGISQTEAGWIGFYASFGACAASLVIARIADNFSKHLKLIIVILFIIGAAFTLWFALACSGFVPYSTVIFYVTTIMSVLPLNAAIPLLYEIACELAYPIGEGTANGLMIMMNNIGGIIFLSVLMIPNIGTNWMNWTLLGSIIVCFPLFTVLKENYKRLNFDENEPGNSTTTSTLVH